MIGMVHNTSLFAESMNHKWEHQAEDSPVEEDLDAAHFIREIVETDLSSKFINNSPTSGDDVQF